MTKNELIVLSGAVFILVMGMVAFTYSNILDWGSKINTADAMQIIITFTLVLITSIYVKRTSDIAEEMRKQRLYMAQPRLILDVGRSVNGKFFVKEIVVGFWNDGLGPALNAEFSVSHSLYEFNVMGYRTAISVGDTPRELNLHVEEPSVDEDPSIEVEPDLVLVASYQDVFRNDWESTLELHWNAVSKQLRPGRMIVAKLKSSAKEKQPSD